ncbi:MAG: hypothetical protein U1F26_08850 [Lysobacterales bacterium]
MLTLLRWGLGLCSLLAGAGWIALAVIGARFRRAWGAAAAHPGLVWGLPALLALVLASVLYPTPTLLHATAAAVALLVGASLWLMRTDWRSGFAGLLYGSAWALYYLASV